jgi:hypothetical protein
LLKILLDLGFLISRRPIHGDRQLLLYYCKFVEGRGQRVASGGRRPGSRGPLGSERQRCGRSYCRLLGRGLWRKEEGRGGEQAWPWAVGRERALGKFGPARESYGARPKGEEKNKGFGCFFDGYGSMNVFKTFHIFECFI